MEAGGKRWVQNPQEWGETTGAMRPPEWNPSPTEWGGGKGGYEASGVEENPGGGRHGVGGRFESPQGADTPRVAGGPRGDGILGASTASKDRRGEDGRGRGGGDENPPTAQETTRQGPDGGDGAARCKLTAAPSAKMEMAEGDGGEELQPENFDGADGVRTEKSMHPCREYDNVASEATERGQASAGGEPPERKAMGAWGHGDQCMTEKGRGGGRKTPARAPRAGTRRR